MYKIYNVIEAINNREIREAFAEASYHRDAEIVIDSLHETEIFDADYAFDELSDALDEVIKEAVHDYVRRSEEDIGVDGEEELREELRNAIEDNNIPLAFGLSEVDWVLDEVISEWRNEEDWMDYENRHYYNTRL